MKTPKVIYLQTCGDCAGLESDTCDFDNLGEVSWCKDKINDSDAVYFSEENVREAIRFYLEQSNRLIERNYRRGRNTISENAEDDFDIIAITRNTEDFIKRLKGGDDEQNK